MKTLQQIYDEAVAGMRVQGAPGYERTAGRCRYRAKTADGRTLKCVAGQLIPDEVYDPKFDFGGGKTFIALCDNYSAFREAMVARGVDVIDATVTGLIDEMQSEHDGAAVASDGKDDDFMERFERGMKRVAEMYGLAYSEPVGV